MNDASKRCRRSDERSRRSGRAVVGSAHGRPHCSVRLLVRSLHSFDSPCQLSPLSSFHSQACLRLGAAKSRCSPRPLVDSSRSVAASVASAAAAALDSTRGSTCDRLEREGGTCDTALSAIASSSLRCTRVLLSLEHSTRRCNPHAAFSAPGDAATRCCRSGRRLAECASSMEPTFVAAATHDGCASGARAAPALTLHTPHRRSFLHRHGSTAAPAARRSRRSYSK